LLHPSFAQRSAVAADAQKFIDNLGDASIGSLTGASLSEAGREARFRSLLEITIRHAQDKQVRAGPLLAGDERRRARRLPALFNDQLVQAYAKKFTEYTSERFQVAGSQANEQHHGQLAHQPANGNVVRGWRMRAASRF